MPDYPLEFVEKFWSRVDKTPGQGPNGTCWIWTGGKTGGYGVVASPLRKRWPLRAHIVAWQLVHGEIPAGLLVCHKCDNPPCVNAHEDLFLGTQRENMLDASAKGRLVGNRDAAIDNPFFRRGLEHPRAKLSTEQVTAIRGLQEAGLGYGVIYGILGIPRRTIRRVLSGESY